MNPQKLINLLLVFCFLEVSTAHHNYHESHQCSRQKNSIFKFSVVSRRNETGHWIAQVHFDHNAEEEGQEPWQMEIDHSTSKCGDQEIISLDTTITSPVIKKSDKPNSKPRRPDYELIPGQGYYKMHVQPKTWIDALNTCANENAHLLILNSESEVKALLPFFAKHPKNLGDWRNNVFYIGIHDYFSDGQYVTIFSKPVSSLGYNKWSAEEKRPDEKCGMVDLWGLLGDANCHDHFLLFICEQEL